MRGGIVSIKLTCIHCGRKFLGEGKYALGRVRANLTNHIKSAHPDKYVPSKWVKERLDRKEKDSIKPQILISGPDPETIKRPYVRKPAPPSSVCFCPKCGCNIRAVQVAIGL